VSTVSVEQGMVAVDRCPMCGSERFETAFEEPPYAVRRCSACGMGWVSPRLDERGLAGIYQDDSYWRSQSPKTLGYSDYRADEELYLDSFRKRLEYVLRDGPDSGRALDVGFAAGFCMAVLRQRGFEVHGVEVSETIGSHARDHFGFESVFFGTLESAPFPEAHFDLITMWDVVEHVVDPQALLERAHALLKPGGLLVVETQDIDSRFARALGPRWHHYKHAEHIYHFTPPSLRRLLGAAGLEVKTMTPRYGGKYVSLDLIAERAGRIHPLLSSALAPLRRLDSISVYVNVMDEIVATAMPRS
jgi:SAM-dependent methyltransferase